MEEKGKEGVSEGPPKKVLGLIASPRKLGNCEVFTKELTRHIPVPHTLELIRLTSLMVKSCRACYGCVMGDRCPIDDDIYFLLEQIAGADAVIIASPVYYLGANAVIKAILDRGFLFFDILEKSYGTPAVLLNFYGIPERIGVAPQMLEVMAAYLGLSVTSSTSVEAALPGESIMKESNLVLARQLGMDLFASRRARKERGCPFCGCEIVRVAAEGFICTVCHGSFTVDPLGAFVRSKDGGILGPPEHMLLHRRWLQGMKARFLEKRREIARAVAPYKNVGLWIEPPRQGSV